MINLQRETAANAALQTLLAIAPKEMIFNYVEVKDKKSKSGTTKIITGLNLNGLSLIAQGAYTIADIMESTSELTLKEKEARLNPKEI